MNRSDYLWIGVKLLGLWILLLAIGAAGATLEPIFQLADADRRLGSDVSAADAIDLSFRQAHYTGQAIAYGLRLVVYLAGAWFFLARTASVVERLDRS